MSDSEILDLASKIQKARETKRALVHEIKTIRKNIINTRIAQAQKSVKAILPLPPLVKESLGYVTSERFALSPDRDASEQYYELKRAQESFDQSRKGNKDLYTEIMEKSIALQVLNAEEEMHSRSLRRAGDRVDFQEICVDPGIDLDEFKIRSVNEAGNVVKKKTYNTVFFEDAIRADADGSVIQRNKVHDHLADVYCYYKDAENKKAAHRDGIQLIPAKEQMQGGYAGAKLKNVTIENNEITSNGVLQGIFASDGLFENLKIKGNTIQTNGQHFIQINGFLSGEIRGNKDTNNDPVTAVLSPLRIGGGSVGVFLVNSFSTGGYSYDTPSGDGNWLDQRLYNNNANYDLAVHGFNMDLFASVYNDPDTTVSSFLLIFGDDFFDYAQLMAFYLPFVLDPSEINPANANTYLSTKMNEHISKLSGAYRGAFAQELALRVHYGYL